MAVASLAAAAAAAAVALLYTILFVINHFEFKMLHQSYFCFS